MRTLAMILLFASGINAHAATIFDILAANNSVAEFSYGKVVWSDTACHFNVIAKPATSGADFAIGFDDKGGNMWFAYAYPTGSSQNSSWVLDEANASFSWFDASKLNDTVIFNYNPKTLIVTGYKVANQKFACSIHL